MNNYVIAEYRHDTGLHFVADIAPGHHILCVGDYYVFTLPLPDVAPGESLRLTRTETGWDVRRMVQLDLTHAYGTPSPKGVKYVYGDGEHPNYGVPWQPMGDEVPLWFDASEQDGDR